MTDISACADTSFGSGQQQKSIDWTAACYISVQE